MSQTTTVTNPHGVNISMSEFTNNVKVDTIEHTVSGDGIFDILMNTGTKHLVAQFDGGRIRSEDYAMAYVQMYQQSLGAALQIWLQKPISEAQRESELAKRALYIRQIEGLDEDYKQKLLKITCDAWAVCFSVAKDSFEAKGIPAPMTSTAINDLFNNFIIPELDMYKYGRDPDIFTKTE